MWRWRRPASVHESARLLSTMPGISDVTAHVIVAEIGVDMTRFASDAHLRSWAGFCPRSDESRQAPFHPRAQGPPLAQDHPGQRGEYQDIGASHFTRRDREKIILRLVRRINYLGCQVQLVPQAA